MSLVPEHLEPRRLAPVVYELLAMTERMATTNVSANVLGPHRNGFVRTSR